MEVTGCYNKSKAMKKDVLFVDALDVIAVEGLAMAPSN